MLCRTGRSRSGKASGRLRNVCGSTCKHRCCGLVDTGAPHSLRGTNRREMARVREEVRYSLATRCVTSRSWCGSPIRGLWPTTRLADGETSCSRRRARKVRETYRTSSDRLHPVCSETGRGQLACRPQRRRPWWRRSLCLVPALVDTSRYGRKVVPGPEPGRHSSFPSRPVVVALAQCRLLPLMRTARQSRRQPERWH